MPAQQTVADAEISHTKLLAGHADLRQGRPQVGHERTSQFQQYHDEQDRDGWTYVAGRKNRDGAPTFQQPPQADRPIQVKPDPWRRQATEDGPIQPPPQTAAQVDVQAFLREVLGHMSSMIVASQKQTMDMVQQMIGQAVPVHVQRSSPRGTDSQGRLFEAIKYTILNPRRLRQTDQGGTTGRNNMQNCHRGMLQQIQDRGEIGDLPTAS